ncbi:MAG: hypothetical protein AAGA08_06735 [Pseudomonadota bacterium]
MLVEVLGLPGSGKTTLIKKVLPQLRALGLPARRADKIVGLPCETPDAPRYLRRSPDRTALYRAQAFRNAYPALMSHVEKRLDLDLTDGFLFSLTGSHYQGCFEYADRFDFIFLDEGFGHRGVSAHLGQDDAMFAQYLELIPVPDLVIHLCPPPRVAFRRAINRHASPDRPKREVTGRLGDEAVFRKRHQMLQTSVTALQARGAEVLAINSADALDDCTAALIPDLQEVLAHHKAARPALHAAE